VGVGTVVSMPLAWLLSYAATLPFYLGLFFFALFGLIIGAVIHRVAAECRPYNPRLLVAGTTVVVLAVWIVSIVMETRDFPGDMAARASSQTRTLGDRSLAEFRTAVADDIRRFLREDYPPGGAVGYVLWVLTSGELEKDRIAGLTRTLIPRQRRYSWAIRAVLSIVLLAFGVGSQTLALRLSTDPIVRAIDAR